MFNGWDVQILGVGPSLRGRAGGREGGVMNIEDMAYKWGGKGGSTVNFINLGHNCTEEKGTHVLLLEQAT